MTVRTVTVAHPDNHQANEDQIQDAIAESVKDDDLKRVGTSYKVLEYSNESGVATTFKLDFDTEKKAEAPKPAKPEADKPARVNGV